MVTFSSVFDVQVLPGRSSSSTPSRPSKNALCSLKTCALYRARSPYAHFNFSYFSVAFSLSLKQNLIAQLWSRFLFSIFVTRQHYTHSHNSLSSQTCYRYRVEICTEHQVEIHVSVGVGGVTTVLAVLEPHVQSHYFLDTPLISLGGKVCRCARLITFLHLCANCLEILGVSKSRVCTHHVLLTRTNPHTGHKIIFAKSISSPVLCPVGLQFRAIFVHPLWLSLYVHFSFFPEPSSLFPALCDYARSSMFSTHHIPSRVVKFCISVTSSSTATCNIAALLSCLLSVFVRC